MVCLALFLPASGLIAAEPADGAAVRIRLVDAETGSALGGIIRALRPGSEQALVLPGLFDRFRGVKLPDKLAGWYVVPAGGMKTALPREHLRLEALCGLETALAEQTVDLSAAAPDEVTIKLRVIFRPEQEHWIAGNTHLHLRDMTAEECERYLREIPAADGLRVLFTSYLERAKDDAAYITNRYPVGDVKPLAGVGMLVNQGEEMRHNFRGYDEGYGHVMLLGINQLVRPVSIGPGITGAGYDEPSLQPGMEEARRQGGTVLWCHNTFGYEDVPSALAGRLDAMNVFDGAPIGLFEQNYYHFLNIGLHLPISTGTDWFMYDFSRVYVLLPGELTVRSWLDALKAGRTMSTNGPFLRLTVDGHEVGDTIALDSPKTVQVRASAIGRMNFHQLQLVHNGRVMGIGPALYKEGYYSCEFVQQLHIDSPGWVAVRIDTQTKHEFDRQLYAHTSPVYLEFAGRRVFELEAARYLLDQLDEACQGIRAFGKFSSSASLQRILVLYEQAAENLRAQITKHST